MDRIVTFLQTGYNGYIVGAVVLAVVVVAVILIAVAVKKKNQRAKVAEAPAPIETAPKADILDQPIPESDPVDLPEGSPETSEAVAAVRLRKERVSAGVEVKPVRKKQKPAPAPQPEPVVPTRTEILKAEEEAEAKKIEASTRRPGTIQIYKDSGGQFRFRIKASNENTVAHSQGYARKSGAKNGIEAVIKIANEAETVDTTKKGTEYLVTIGRPVFEVYRDNEGKFRFRLRAANTSNILASQGYTSKENCFNGIKSVKYISFNHTLVDTTRPEKQ